MSVDVLQTALESNASNLRARILLSCKHIITKEEEQLTTSPRRAASSMDLKSGRRCMPLASLAPSAMENSSASNSPTVDAAAELYSTHSGAMPDAAAIGGGGCQPGIKGPRPP